MEELERRKLKANAFMKEQKYYAAISMYTALADEVLYIVTDGMKEKGVMDKNTVAIRLNMALAYLKLKQYRRCLEECDKILEIDASNEKCLYRKGEVSLNFQSITLKRLT